MFNIILALIPTIVGVLYATVGVMYLFKHDYAWSLVWLAYAAANVGMVIIGGRQ